MDEQDEPTRVPVKVILWRRYDIEAAHQLTEGVPETHKCRRLHGHRYVVHIGVKGPIASDGPGMVIESSDLDTQVLPILRVIDHWNLNTLHERVPGPITLACAQNPTVERLCVWLVHSLGFMRQPQCPFKLCGVRVEEDSRSCAEWRAE